MSDDLAQNSSIKPYGEIELFPEIPDYAITFLWLEWEKIRKKKPPTNIICTTLKAYQKFCQIVNSDGTDFPSVFVTKDAARDVHSFFNGGWVPRDPGKKLELVQKIQQAQDALAQWDDADSNLYVAFVHEGLCHQGVLEALSARLIAGGKR